MSPSAFAGLRRKPDGSIEGSSEPRERDSHCLDAELTHPRIVASESDDSNSRVRSAPLRRAYRPTQQPPRETCGEILSESFPGEPSAASSFVPNSQSSPGELQLAPAVHAGRTRSHDNDAQL